MGIRTLVFSEQTEHLRASVERFSAEIADYRRQGKRVIASSSFQTQSMPLLQLIAAQDEAIPVYFLDTGFHFPETLSFRDTVIDELGLSVHSIESAIPKVAQRTTSGLFLWAEDTTRCCATNKTAVMDPILAAADIWISGVRRDQSSTRAGFARTMSGPHDTTRLHPLLDWTKRDVWRWIADNDLPRHPLELKGYDSIGCQPCTIAPDPFGERSGRWDGQAKTECGLHTTLVGSTLVS